MKISFFFFFSNARILQFLTLHQILLTVSSTKTRVTWVNGIGHTKEHMEDGGEQMTLMFGGKQVEFCHNPTAMIREDDYVGFLGDLTQAGTQKLGRITAEVDELVKHLREAIQEIGPNGKVIHIAHSQGALITALAAKKMTAEELCKMEVICFGGAACMRRSEYPALLRIVNYYSVNDPLLFVVPSAVKALRSGFGSWGGGQMSIRHYQQQEDPEFVFLSPRGGDPVIDHALFGPTYGPALGKFSSFTKKLFFSRYCNLILKKNTHFFFLTNTKNIYIAWEGRRYQQMYLDPFTRTYRMTILTSKSLMNSSIEKLNTFVEFLVQVVIIPLLVQCLNFYLWQKNKIYNPTVAYMQEFLSSNKTLNQSIMKLQKLYSFLSELIKTVMIHYYQKNKKEKVTEVYNIMDTDLQLLQGQKSVRNG